MTWKIGVRMLFHKICSGYTQQRLKNKIEKNYLGWQGDSQFRKKDVQAYCLQQGIGEGERIDRVNICTL